MVLLFDVHKWQTNCITEYIDNRTRKVYTNTRLEVCTHTQTLACLPVLVQVRMDLYSNWQICLKVELVLSFGILTSISTVEYGFVLIVWIFTQPSRIVARLHLYSCFGILTSFSTVEYGFVFIVWICTRTGRFVARLHLHSCFGILTSISIGEYGFGICTRTGRFEVRLYLYSCFGILTSVSTGEYGSVLKSMHLYSNWLICSKIALLLMLWHTYQYL